MDHSSLGINVEMEDTRSLQTPDGTTYVGSFIGGNEPMAPRPERTCPKNESMASASGAGTGASSGAVPAPDTTLGEMRLKKRHAQVAVVSRYETRYRCASPRNPPRKAPPITTDAGLVLPAKSGGIAEAKPEPAEYKALPHKAREKSPHPPHPPGQGTVKAPPPIWPPPKQEENAASGNSELGLAAEERSRRGDC